MVNGRSTPANSEGREGEGWVRERGELGPLVALLVEAVATQGPSAANAALRELAEAMEAHFTVKEEVYFPLVEDLRPDQRYSVERARGVHTRVRRGLGELSRSLNDGRLHEARSLLGDLLAELRAHEQEAARLIAGLRQTPLS
jgi:hypothetical protein